MIQPKIYVVGLGEVGGPLLENIAEHAPAVGIDINTEPPDAPCSVMHVCIGQKDRNFEEIVIEYERLYSPNLLIINSTVIPGTCRRIAAQVRCPVAHSPIRGKHARMKADQRHYSKFVSGVTREAASLAENHFRAVGFNVRRMSTVESTEFAKISSTSYFGLHIAWAQEVERFCDQFELDYEEVIQFYEEIPYFPDTKFFPGIIGGHCVLPNIELLKQVGLGPMIDAIERSNRLKVAREESSASAEEKVAA